MTNAYGGGREEGGTLVTDAGGITYPDNPVENEVFEYIDELEGLLEKYMKWKMGSCFN
jgi:hypothetical protein